MKVDRFWTGAGKLTCDIQGTDNQQWEVEENEGDSKFSPQNPDEITVLMIKKCETLMLIFW